MTEQAESGMNLIELAEHFRAFAVAWEGQSDHSSMIYGIRFADYTGDITTTQLVEAAEAIEASLKLTDAARALLGASQRMEMALRFRGCTEEHIARLKTGK